MNHTTIIVLTLRITFIGEICPIADWTHHESTPKGPTLLTLVKPWYIDVLGKASVLKLVFEFWTVYAILKV
jgi:hypothetical protein